MGSGEYPIRERIETDCQRISRMEARSVKMTRGCVMVRYLFCCLLFACVFLLQWRHIYDFINTPLDLESAVFLKHVVGHIQAPQDILCGLDILTATHADYKWEILPTRWYEESFASAMNNSHRAICIKMFREDVPVTRLLQGLNDHTFTLHGAMDRPLVLVAYGDENWGFLSTCMWLYCCSHVAMP